METRKFSSLYVGQLRLSNLFALNKATIDIASQMQSSLNDLAVAALTILISVNAEIDKRLKQPSGSLITPELKQLDIKRDSIFDEIKRDVKTASKSSNYVKSNAGKILLHFLTPYWATALTAMNTESGLIGEIINRYYNDPTLVTGGGTIGIDGLWKDLLTVNTSFETLYYERNAELAAKDDPAGKFRTDGVKSYENFCTIIEQSVNLTPTDVLVTLFDRMDNLRKTYHALIPKKKEEKTVEE